jgi:hypothetical protein
VVIHLAAPDAASAAYLMQASIGRFRAHLIAHSNGRWELEIDAPDGSHRFVVDVLDAVASWLSESTVDELTAEADGCGYLVGRDGWARLPSGSATR